VTCRNGLNGFWFALPLDPLAGAPDATFYGGLFLAGRKPLFRQPRRRRVNHGGELASSSVSAPSRHRLDACVCAGIDTPRARFPIKLH
jgi:hypothetical protein